MFVLMYGRLREVRAQLRINWSEDVSNVWSHMGGRVQLAIRCAIGVKDAVKMLAKMVYNFKDASAGVNGRVNQFVKSGANRKIKCSLSLYKCTSFREVE